MIIADIIKTVPMFIKTIFKDSAKVKRVRNYLLRCNLCLYFFYIAKFANFRWKYADVTRIFFRYSMTVPIFIIVRCVLQILGGGGNFLHPPPFPYPWAAPKQPIVNWVKIIQEFVSAIFVIPHKGWFNFRMIVILWGNLGTMQSKDNRNMVEL